MLSLATRGPVTLEDSLLRADEVAAYLNLGRSKVYEMLATGELPVVRLGRTVRVPRRALVEWIEAQTQQPSAAPR